MRRILDVDSLILVTGKVIEREWQRICLFCFEYYRILPSHLFQIPFGDFYFIFFLLLDLNLGGSSFGFMSGANAEDDGSLYKADVTSYGN